VQEFEYNVLRRCCSNAPLSFLTHAGEAGVMLCALCTKLAGFVGLPSLCHSCC
jgi:hypothetical protein